MSRRDYTILSAMNGQSNRGRRINAEASLRGRIGAFSLHSTHDPRITTRAARQAFMRRFENAVDPDRLLPEGERQRRAECARRLYFARLALKSAKARRRRRLPESEKDG